jgi:hypothetical protein
MALAFAMTVLDFDRTARFLTRLASETLADFSLGKAVPPSGSLIQHLQSIPETHYIVTFSIKEATHASCLCCVINYAATILAQPFCQRSLSLLLILILVAIW